MNTPQNDLFFTCHFPTTFRHLQPLKARKRVVITREAKAPLDTEIELAFPVCGKIKTVLIIQHFVFQGSRRDLFYGSATRHFSLPLALSPKRKKFFNEWCLVHLKVHPSLLRRLIREHSPFRSQKAKR